LGFQRAFLSPVMILTQAASRQWEKTVTSG
jgi:hypothetical protein